MIAVSEYRRQRGKISVIVPAYNEERFIGPCLESLLHQEYDNLEIIVVDDGSTDETSAYINAAAERDARITVIRQDNAGLSAARNAGLDHAQGEFIAFLDANDLIAPEHLSNLYSLLDQEDVDVAVTNLTVFDGDESFLTRSRPEFGETVQYTASEAVAEYSTRAPSCVCPWEALSESSLWEGVRFPVGYIHEDLPTVYRVLLKARKVSFSPSESYGYRFSSTGLNRARTTDDKARVVPLLESQIETLVAEHPELEKPARCFLVSLCFHLYLGSARGSLSSAYSSHLRRCIRRYRSGIMRDGRARSKTRAACALSYVGFPVVRIAFSLGRSVMHR